ncbi:MAG TPA: serine hydrolase domain-containing protein [Longimicrobiales bacterium]|nr:serine hydrolase domain-containing protein [Longimicrobiales bacterium]
MKTLASTTVRLVLVALFTLPAAVSGQQAPRAGFADASARVDGIFQAWNSPDSPGCAVGVAQGGSPVLMRAYGMADLEHDIANTPATIFEAGSVSKQFTAAAIVLLAEQGRISLDDDVRKYVPELPDFGTPVTIRHMMTHTSGLRDWGSVASIAGWGRTSRTHTHDHVVDILSRQRGLNFEPGSEYSYSNSGYNLMAVIVERVSGMPFAEFSQRFIFEPLGLKDTQWRDDYTRIVKGRSSAYSFRGGDWAIDRPIENVHGNGGLLTTVADLITWNQALAEGRIGGATFVQTMHTPQVLNNGEAITYAGGLMIDEYRGVPQVSHTGSTSGYRAFLGRYPDQQVDVAVLCNAGNVNPGNVGRQVAEVFLGDALRPAAARPASQQGLQNRPAAPEYTAAELAAFAGEYYSPDVEITVRVTVEDGRLVLHRRPATRMTLTPAAPDEFGSGLGRLTFIRDDQGMVSQFSINQARVYDLRFDRVPE